MINLIWAAMILVGIITALLTGHMEDVNAGIIDAGSDAVSLCITMLGIVTMWCGIMKNRRTHRSDEEMVIENVPCHEILISETFPGASGI